jgi:hypothetical protein
MTTTEQRVLDAWIAEHVMGWTWWRFRVLRKSGHGYDRWQQLIPPHETWHRNPKWGGIPQPQGEGRYLENRTDLSIFKPTTDPAAAMMVLEKCLSVVGTTVHLERRTRQQGFKKDEFCIWFAGKYGEAIKAETLPLAIVLFAKKLFSK